VRSRVAAILLGLLALAAICAPAIAPHEATARFADSVNAPPTRIRFVADGALTRPYFHPSRLTDRLLGVYVEDVSTRVPLTFFANGRLVSDPGDPSTPLLLLGGDSSGRDVFARLVIGARASLGIALIASVVSMTLGVLVGGLAGARGGWVDAVLMRLADVVAVLPAIYLVVTLRSALPLVLPASVTVALLIVLLSIVGAPWIARGVRPIVAAERQTAYAEAARAAGATPWRVLWHHLLPASFGFVARQASLLVPAFVLAEATLSFIGLGLPDTVPSWGTSLQDASTLGSIALYPWILAPAVAVFVLTLLVNLAVRDDPLAAGVEGQPR
jgi:peptide/nickel transport system permease protein